MMWSIRVQRGCLKSQPFLSTRTQSTLPPLPPDAAWRKEFPNNISRRERVFVSNPRTARTLANALLPRNSSGAGKVVIEAFPGPGVLSRALLELPKSSLRKLIILEDDESFLKYLKPLQETDPRVTVVPMSGHSWDTYTQLEEQGLLEDVKAVPWDSQDSDLHFVAHLSLNVKGEQLIAQLFRSIPERAWLFKYGRVPMHILMSDHVWSRLSASPGPSQYRCKLSVIAEGTADNKPTVEPRLLAPYSQHFYPVASVGGKGVPTRKPGQPMHAITSIPYMEQVIQKGQTDEWDYCLRKLFVQRNTKLKDAMDSLAPGARSVLSRLTDSSVPRSERVDVAKRVRDLNVADWALIMRAFHHWPFKPSDILITDAFLHETEH